MTPEFSKVIKLSELGGEPRKGKLSATCDERTKLAKRFDLPKINSLTADYVLQAKDDRILFEGIVISDLSQVCAISGQEFPAHVIEQFNIAFVAKSGLPVDEEEVELAADDCDVIEFDAAQIDIGEAVAQTLNLALDPYPRGPDADKIATEKGLKSEEEAGPFGVLASLKDKLG